MIAEFEYHRCNDVNGALKLLMEYQDSAKVFAGGQSLLTLLKQGLINPGQIIDVNGVRDLDYIKLEGNEIRIGALTSHRSIESSALIKDYLPVLVDAEGEVASIQIRNWGTLGGNVCHADPASDLTPILLTLGARARVISHKGEREVALDQFFTGYLETVLEPYELLAEIKIPLVDPSARIAYKKFNLRYGDTAVATVCAYLGMDSSSKRCKEARVTVGAVNPVPLRIVAAEQLLKGKQLDDKIFAQAGELAQEVVDPVSDLYGSEEFKRNIVQELTVEVLNMAVSKGKQ